MLMTHLTVLGIRSRRERADAGTISEAHSDVSCVEMLPALLVFIISLPIKRAESIKD